jgi:hypothetical protein
MNKIIQGVIHGSTIQLSENPGLADGQSVQVVVQAVEPPRPWGEGIRKSAGALADQWTEEDDKILEEIYQDRKRDSHREIPA